MLGRLWPESVRRGLQFLEEKVNMPAIRRCVVAGEGKGHDGFPIPLEEFPRFNRGEKVWRFFSARPRKVVNGEMRKADPWNGGDRVAIRGRER